MINVFSFEFEELPLVITTDGIHAALINGCAEIQYTRDGYWEIDSVSVEGYQPVTPEERAAGKRPWVYVKAPFDLEMLIALRLEGEWSDRVQDAIANALVADREDAADARADMRRDHLMGL